MWTAFIGLVIGIIPGAGASIAAFVAYQQSRVFSKTPHLYGTGHPDGVIAPESANNGVTSGTLVPLMAIGAAFMMGLLFLIAGYFTPRSYDRKGPGPFLVDRLKRLGIPLLLFAIVINPIIEYLIKTHTSEFQGSYWRFIPPYIRNLDTAGFGVTLFIEALLIFSIFYVLWRLLTHSSPQPNTPGQWRSAGQS